MVSVVYPDEDPPRIEAVHWDRKGLGVVFSDFEWEGSVWFQTTEGFPEAASKYERLWKHARTLRNKGLTGLALLKYKLSLAGPLIGCIGIGLFAVMALVSLLIWLFPSS